MPRSAPQAIWATGPPRKPLLRRLHLVQNQLSAEAKRNGDHARTMYLPRHLRTLTELAERLGRFPERYVRDADESSARSGAPPFFAGSSPLPFRTQLARALAIGDWMNIVDRIVEEDPGAYAAIVHELGRLAESGSRR